MTSKNVRSKINDLKDLISIIDTWQSAHKKIVLARVIKTWNASPRPVGSVMLINEDQEIAGSVSGGCVEGAVVKAAMSVLENQSAQVLDFGVADNDAWSVGLSCGGRIQVLVEPFPAAQDNKWIAIRAAITQNKGVVWMSPISEKNLPPTLVFQDSSTLGEVGSELKKATIQAYQDRKSQRVETENGSYFLHVLPKKNQLFIIGAAHITVDLVDLAKPFGFESIVIDPRGIFAHKTQFSIAPDQLFNEYPSEILPHFELDQHSFAVVLSHDPKIDDNALELLLASKVAYIGALGSKRTHAKRVARLEEAGFSTTKIELIHGPVGVDINAKTPREIALSIMSEIIQVKNKSL